ncbi:hypothetical protein FACS189472_00590 [Alphaproteobacteria bacterium]|nr:hypothetical protein FACS189472_00590 [Alphaproteobacteria bacterium]
MNIAPRKSANNTQKPSVVPVQLVHLNPAKKLLDQETSTQMSIDKERVETDIRKNADDVLHILRTEITTTPELKALVMKTRKLAHNIDRLSLCYNFNPWGCKLRSTLTEHQREALTEIIYGLEYLTDQLTPHDTSAPGARATDPKPVRQPDRPSVMALTKGDNTEQGLIGKICKLIIQVNPLLNPFESDKHDGLYHP